MLAMAGSLSFAANRALRINEVLLRNSSSITDKYGNHSPWIEFYNPSATTINLGGLFLTDDIQESRKFPIRRTHKGTIIPPYQSVVLFLDGRPELGTFHSAMQLDPTQEQTIYLFDGDGKKLIDQVTIPANIPVDHSYARLRDAGEEWGVIALPTPGDLNYYDNTTAQRIEEFREHDPSGLIMTLIAITVVFSALAVLYIVFKYIGKWNARSQAKQTSKKAGITPVEAKERLDVPAGMYAAIAMALYEHSQEVHDQESDVITIEQTRKRYSPWSSKIHTLRQVPQVRRRK